jgi:hemicentin
LRFLKKINIFLVTPKITSTSPNETIVAIGEPFSLRCGASGHPLPAITWELNNENIETSLTSEYRIEGDTLFVKELPQKGTSSFRCTVHNSAGLDEVEFTVKVIAPPVVNKEGIQTLNVSKTDPTVINCDVQVDLSDSEIEWQKDGIQISRDGNAKIDGKNLKIESTMLNDEGNYTCIAMNPAGNATQTTKLHVGVPPKINEELGRIVVKKGERAELLCEAVGIPPPQITWLKDNHTLDRTPTEESKTTAIFEDIQPEQAGVYTCRATNWAGTVFKDVDLVVLIPPEITNEKANFTANLRDNIILPCNATGIPEPVVSWLKVPDVDIIGKEDKYQILGSSLAIKNISLDDDGFYHCIAKSDAGQTVATRKVTVICKFFAY